MTITFNTKGYDGFIDFIKAYAILCVLFGHTFLWLDKVGYGALAGMQVPLFILIQSFHAFKNNKTDYHIRKALHRVMVPFFIIEAITVFIAVITRGGGGILSVSILKCGGYGPGAYYPWIYLQVAFLLPFFAKLLSRIPKTVSLIAFLIVCESFEILFSVIDCPEWIYRLLAVRYLFLIYLGWIWVREGIEINLITITLSLLSLAAIVYFEYFSIDDEPWFFNTKWSYHRWPCYFYVAYGLSALLNALWRKIKRYGFIIKCIKVLAKSSYEIFLIQMSVIWLFKYKDVEIVGNQYLQYCIWLVIVWGLSIGGGIFVNKYLTNIHTVMPRG